jgi:predicted  nucleic acid-binding Zn-ribbon protein
MPGEHTRKAWLLALAWLARDQECRFDDVLDWRRAISDPGSLARGLSATTTLDAFRALLGAIDPKEHKLRGEIGHLERERSEMNREAAHREWQVAKKRTQLATDLSLREDELPYGVLAIKVFQDSARARLSTVAIADPTVDVSDIDALRNEHDEAWSRAETLASSLAEIDVHISEIDSSVRRMQGETPGLSFSVHSAEHPICPICEVPIDRVLAEGCKLSQKVSDLDEVRRRRDQAREELAKEKRRLEDYKQKKPDIAAALASVRSHADELRRRLRAAEHARDSRADAWYSARRLLDEADRLYGLLSAQEKAAAEAGHLDERIEKKRVEVAAYRDERAHVFGRLSEIFDALIRALVGPRATGRVTHDGNGLHLAVDLGGDRSSPAIGSLKVLAFDLAAMCMSIEGSTHVPAFLIHDSPREADLGLSPYHRLFELVRSLEDIGGQPLFQYIVTTTTRPTENLQKAPWLVLTLGGEPAEKRLLKCDLR